MPQVTDPYALPPTPQMALYASPNCLNPQHATSAGDKFGWASGLSSRCYPVTWLFNNYEYQVRVLDVFMCFYAT